MSRKIRLPLPGAVATPTTETAERSPGIYMPMTENPVKKQRHKDRPFVATPNTLHIFTDGSSSKRDGSGGWGVCLLWNDKRKFLYGGCAQTTNNRMELTAILRALEARKSDVQTVVYSDSQYAINAVTVWHHGWRRRGWVTTTGASVSNVDLIEAIVAKITPNIVFRWVKGHVGHENNEKADKLASLGRKAYGMYPVEQSAEHTGEF